MKKKQGGHTGGGGGYVGKGRAAGPRRQSEQEKMGAAHRAAVPGKNWGVGVCLLSGAATGCVGSRGSVRAAAYP